MWGQHLGCNRNHGNAEKIRLYAHVLTVQSEPVYSPFSAAQLHGLFICKCSALVHITAPAPASGTSSAKDVKSHHDVLDDLESEPLTVRNGNNVRTTTLERTAVDYTRVGGFAEAVIIGDYALANGARLDLMWAMVNSATVRCSVRRVRRVLRSLDGL